jgi:hypothetical protein
MSQSHAPLAEEPVTASAPPEPPQDRKRAFTFCASSFGVVRLEDVHEIANLKADLVACYRPVNSQEMFALERMAIAQQLILRAARLDAGLFTSAMNEVLNLDNNPIVTMDPDMIGDIEVTRQQNRNFCIAEGFRRIAKESDLMNLALRYRIQAERDYRRALEEFQRLERLRPKLPKVPNLLSGPDGKDDVVPAWELNPWIPKASPKDVPVKNDAPAPEAMPAKPEPVPAAAAPLADVSLRSLSRQETTRPYIPEAGQSSIGPQASFPGTRAVGAAPQFTGVWNVSSDAPATHRSVAFLADLLSTRPRARASVRNSEAATPVSLGTRLHSRLRSARACRPKLSCGDGSSSASAPPELHPKPSASQ